MTFFKKHIKVIIIIGIILIPILYSFFYLKAFWDPYNNLKEIKVGVVNNDKGEEGSKLVKNIIKNKTLLFEKIDSTSAEEALINQKYYALIIIPANFSYQLKTINDSNRIPVTLTYNPNQKYNYLASQIINKAVMKIGEQLQSKITYQVVDKLSKELQNIPNDLSKVEMGSAKIKAGAETLLTGTISVNAGLNEVYTGSKLISNQTANLPKLIASNNAFVMGEAQFDNSLKTYITNVNAVLNNYNSDGSLDSLINGGNSLVINSNNINSNAILLNNKINSLNNLNDGNQLLTSSLLRLKDGTETLKNGAQELTIGVNAFNSEINKKIQNTNESVKKLDGLADYTSQAVKIDEVAYAKVNNYGIAFMPYFMSLSLWVGSLMIFVGLYYDPDNRFKVIGRNTNNHLYQSLGYAIIAIAQALVLGFILKIGLGFNVEHAYIYYFSCVVTALTFLSIMQFLMCNFRDAGKFLSVLFLVVQLASSGGSFPIETVPSIFRSLYNYMPMTYTIRLFRESIILYNENMYLKNLMVVIVIFIIFTMLHILFKTIKKKYNIIRS